MEVWVDWFNIIFCIEHTAYIHYPNFCKPKVLNFLTKKMFFFSKHSFFIRFQNYLTKQKHETFVIAVLWNSIQSIKWSVVKLHRAVKLRVTINRKNYVDIACSFIKFVCSLVQCKIGWDRFLSQFYLGLVCNLLWNSELQFLTSK